MRAEIICVGSELLLGDIADTNTQYLARRLSGLGIDLFFSTSVGDNLGRLVECLQRGFERSDAVLTSGGLGPTDDDLTREAIARVVNEVPAVDDALAADLRAFFGARGLAMTRNNLKQAWLVPSAHAIPNDRGTAPGWWVSKNGKHIIAMPGPPGELHHMWERHIEPHLLTGEAVIRSRTLKLFGVSESRVDELLHGLTPSANPTVAVYAKQDGIYVRITTKSMDEAAALQVNSATEAKVRAIFGNAIWGADDDTFDSVVVALLERHRASVAVGESVSAGEVAAMLARSDRGAARLRGALVLPAEESRERTAAGLARLAIEQFGADIGLGVAGRPGADPNPEIAEIDIAVVWPARRVEAVASQRTRYFRRRSLGAYYALDELRKLLEQE